MVIYTPKELQIERLMKRDNISENEAKIKNLKSNGYWRKRKLADMVIDNSQNLKHFKMKLKELLERLYDIYKI